MAVSNNLYTPTEDLILAKPRRCFRSGVRWQHWQLRSLIGTDSQNYIYFPVGLDNRNCHVLRLNTKTRETEMVKRLSFDPRCLVARNGWVCCGGEKGIFSGFRVGQRNTPAELEGRFDLPADLPADLPLPLSLDLSDAALTTLVAEARLEKSLVAQSSAFGKDRVNCITLWFPPALVQPFEGAYDQGVAVLAHNDRTVIVVSLRDQEALDKITYPEFMNRGVLSPDGRLLIAISDDPYLYVHERREKRSGAGTPVRVGDRPAYEWNLCGRIQLKSQSKDDRSESRGSFAASFSSTGRYLAVGTQYGTISIFNVAALTLPGVNALVTSFEASRPNEEFGAVRDMAFSPGPTDLLAWTEDRGRVGVVDMRTGFDSRQMLYLDKEDDFEHLTVTDRGTIDPRLLEQRGERSETLLSNFASVIESSAENRQNRQSEGQPPLSQYNIPLTAEETAVLEAIQDFRRRQDQYNAPSGRTGAESGSNSSNSNSNGDGGSGSGSASGSGPGTRSFAAERAAERAARELRNREHTAVVSRAVSQILDNIRDQRERVRDTQERLRAREDNTAERRRYAASPLPGLDSTIGAARSGTSGRGALVARLIANATIAPSTGGWENVEALAAYLVREWEENPTRRFLGNFMSSRTRPGPYDTAGLAWSDDGELLFIGAENGIYEFSVNSLGRRLSPSITLS